MVPHLRSMVCLIIWCTFVRNALIVNSNLKTCHLSLSPMPPKISSQHSLTQCNFLGKGLHLTQRELTWSIYYAALSMVVSQCLWSWIRESDAGDGLYLPSQVKNESKVGSCVYVASITGGKAAMLTSQNQQKEQLAICPTMCSCLCHSVWGVREIKPLWRWKREYRANVGMFLMVLISVWSFVPNSLVLLDSSCQTSPGQALQTYHSPISTTVAGKWVI